MRFFKTVIQVEVLSEDQPIDDLNLRQIAHEIYDGDCVGTVETISTKEMAPSECVEELIKMGSEPEFFGLDHDGNSTIEDY